MFSVLNPRSENHGITPNALVNTKSWKLVKLGINRIELWISQTQIENYAARLNSLVNDIITDLYISHIWTNSTETPLINGS